MTVATNNKKKKHSGKPKRHHYLSEFYLKGFCRGSYLWVYDRDKNEYRQQHPKKTAVINYYYSVIDKDGNKKVEVESKLDMRENDAKHIIDKLDNRTQITHDEKEALSVFVGFLRNRTPEFERTHNHAIGEMIKKTNKLFFDSEERVKSLLKRYETDKGEKVTVSPQDLIDFAKKEQYGVILPRERSLIAMLKLSEKMAKYFSILNWVILRVPDDKCSFITTDAPFVLLPPRDLHKGHYGILTRGTEKVIPLSRTTCLVMLDKGDDINYFVCNRDMVRSLNLTISSQCYRFLIGRDRQLLTNLVDTTGIDKFEWKPWITVG